MFSPEYLHLVSTYRPTHIVSARGLRYVKKSILILVFFVNARHKRSRRRQHLIHKDKNGLFRGELDTLANYVDELPDSQIGGDEVFLFVDGGNVGLFDFFADDLELLLVE